MTNAEAKIALFNRTPVIYNDAEYLYIKELIYWVDDNGKFRISATLFDKTKHCTVRTQLKDVTPIHDK